MRALGYRDVRMFFIPFLGGAVSGKASGVAPYKQAFGPMPAEVFHVPFPVEQYGVTVKDSLRALEILKEQPAAPPLILVSPMSHGAGAMSSRQAQQFHWM